MYIHINSKQLIALKDNFCIIHIEHFDQTEMLLLIWMRLAGSDEETNISLSVRVFLNRLSGQVENPGSVLNFKPSFKTRMTSDCSWRRKTAWEGEFLFFPTLSWR